jgi:hypothetical protein
VEPDTIELDSPPAIVVVADEPRLFEPPPMVAFAALASMMFWNPPAIVPTPELIAFDIPPPMVERSEPVLMALP